MKCNALPNSIYWIFLPVERWVKVTPPSLKKIVYSSGKLFLPRIFSSFLPSPLHLLIPYDANLRTNITSLIKLSVFYCFHYLIAFLSNSVIT